MAGKRARDDESRLKDDRPDEPGREDEDELLKDDEDNRSTAMEVETDSAKSSDTLESTLMKLNDNMSTVTHSMSTMQQAILRLANSQRPSKRQRMDELSDSDNDSIASPDEDSDSLLENVTKTGPTREPKDDLLDTIADDLNADEQTDKDVSDKLAKIINKRRSEKLNPDKLSEKLKKHARPGNLDNLVDPRVNPEIWANMSHAVKRADLRTANTQTIVSKVGTIIAKCTENLLQARKTAGKDIDLDEMVGFHTDALALLGHTQNELSMKRREAIRPSLKKEYAGLCSQNAPVTKLLFGDDLQQQLNNIKASNKITHTSANADKSQRSGFKGSNSERGRNRFSNQYFKRPFHSQAHWRNRDKSKNSKFPLYKKKEGGKN